MLRGFKGGSPAAMRRALVSIGEADTAVNAIAQKARMDVNFILCVGGGMAVGTKGNKRKGRRAVVWFSFQGSWHDIEEVSIADI